MNRSSLPAIGAPAGLATGTWRIDPVRSSVTFSVRHLMIRVRGRFREVGGQIVIGEALASCSVAASIATVSMDTGEADARRRPEDCGLSRLRELPVDGVHEHRHHGRGHKVHAGR